MYPFIFAVMTPCGDNANACAASGHVTQASPKREDLSPAGASLLADYYAKQIETRNEDRDKIELESILHQNSGTVMQAHRVQEGRNSDHSSSNTSHLANGCCTSQVTTSVAPRMSIQPPSAFKDTTSRRPDFSPSKRQNSKPVNGTPSSVCFSSHIYAKLVYRKRNEQWCLCCNAA